MPTITAQSIISKAKTTLQDTTNVRWTDAELLTYLNDGQRAVAAVRPDACSVTASITLVAGTRQAIPDAGTAILRAVRNMGTNGTTPGRAIRQVPMDLLDANVPDWHASPESTTLQHVAVDQRSPHTFYTYPRATAGTQIEIIYAAPPADVVALVDTINIDDIYATPLYDYVCFRAYTKDQETTGNAERAKSHFDLFSAFMSSKSEADSAVAAKQGQIRG